MELTAPFAPGDIIQHKNSGSCAIVNFVDNYYLIVGCFNNTTSYTLKENDWGLWRKIGTYDLTNITAIIKEAQNSYYDIQTQVNMAIQIMDNTYANEDGKNKVLIGTDISVNKKTNIVRVQVYKDIGDPYTWVSVLDIYKKYNLKLPK